MEFAISTTEVEGRIVIGLTGEFDIDAAPSLRTVIDQAEQSSMADVIVDMSAVTFMDSSGLGCLIRAYKLFDRNGRRLRIADPSPRVVQILKVTGQYERFTEPDPTPG